MRQLMHANGKIGVSQRVQVDVDPVRVPVIRRVDVAARLSAFIQIQCIVYDRRYAVFPADGIQHIELRFLLP